MVTRTQYSVNNIFHPFFGWAISGILLLMALGCQAVQGTEPNKNIFGPEGAVSIFMPASLTAFAECTSITAEVVVDDKPPVPLTVDCSTETVTGTVEELEAKNYTFTINYYVDGL